MADKDMKETVKTKKGIPSFAETATGTQALKIWNSIKNKDIDVFSITGSVVSNYCTPVLIDPSKCYLTYKASAVLPALETALKDYNVSQVEKFIVVEKK